MRANQVDNRNKSLLSPPLSVMPKNERVKFLSYIRLLFPIDFDADALHINFIKYDSYVQTHVPYDLFLLLYKLDKDIRISDVVRIKNAIEAAYSGSWTDVLKTLVRWPRTDVPLGIQQFFPEGWQFSGLLRISGYVVGQSGTTASVRRAILSGIVERDDQVSTLNATHRERWGSARTLDRLLKLARVLAVLCRNAKGSPRNYKKAITEWEADLAYLKDKYFYAYLNLDGKPWPSTDLKVLAPMEDQ